MASLDTARLLAHALDNAYALASLAEAEGYEFTREPWWPHARKSLPVVANKIRREASE